MNSAVKGEMWMDSGFVKKQDPPKKINIFIGFNSVNSGSWFHDLDELGVALVTCPLEG